MIHVAARSKEHGNIFLANHNSLLRSKIIIEHGQRSYFSLLNRVINDSSEDFACIVHDDVLLCSNFPQKVDSLVEILNRDWPNWGIAGNSGIASIKIGYSALNLIRYISDPHGGPNLAGIILPAMNIDGNVILLNIKALRDKCVQLPELEGFHLYDIILSIETIRAGLGVFIVPQLACWHGSGGNQKEFDKAKKSPRLYSYLSNRLINRRIPTINGYIQIPIENPTKKLQDKDIIDIEIDSLITACKNRPVKNVAVVTRTQFSRHELLDRCLRSISSFISQLDSTTQFKNYVVSTYDKPNYIELPPSVEILKAPYESDRDTRYLLVKFAVEHIDADYFWFIDDDDFVFPNEAVRLALTINASPINSIFFLDCERFEERPFPSGDINEVELYKSKREMYFSAERFLCSLSGHNESPFCGVIYSRKSLLSIPQYVFDSVTYLEDFMTTLNTLINNESVPVVVNKLFVGISMRETGNTITEKDRTKWNRSMSEVTSHLVNRSTFPQFFSLPLNTICSKSNESDIAYMKAQLNMVFQSKSWRMTRPLRYIMRQIRAIRCHLTKS